MPSGKALMLRSFFVWLKAKKEPPGFWKAKIGKLDLISGLNEQILTKVCPQKSHFCYWFRDVRNLTFFDPKISDLDPEIVVSGGGQKITGFGKIWQILTKSRKIVSRTDFLPTLQIFQISMLMEEFSILRTPIQDLFFCGGNKNNMLVGCPCCCCCLLAHATFCNLCSLQSCWTLAKCFQRLLYRICEIYRYTNCTYIGLKTLCDVLRRFLQVS